MKVNHNVIIFAVVVLVFALVAMAVLTKPTPEEREESLRSAVASCRQMGGEPRLEYANGFGTYHLKECWLER